jgi:hypothetical protein
VRVGGAVAAPLAADLQLVPVVGNRRVRVRDGLGVDVAPHAEGHCRVRHDRGVGERVARDGEAFIDDQGDGDAGVDVQLLRVDELVQVETGVAGGRGWVGAKTNDEHDRRGRRD